MEWKSSMASYYSSLLKRIIMPLADRAMNTKIIKYYYQIKSMQELSKEDILDWQNAKLRQLINFSYNNTKYYHALFDNIKIKPNDIRGVHDLREIPILTKEEIRKNYKNLLPQNIYSINYKKSATGGSTGDPLKYLLDNESWSFSNANYIINWEKAGYKYGDKYIALGSASLFVDAKQSIKHKIYYKLKNKIGLNGINMSDDICREYIIFIKKDKIKYIYGYASAIYLLAKHVLENNISVNISVCFPTSEILTDSYRDTIKKAFNCEIVNCYGAHDGGITAFEHEKGYFKVGYNSLITIKEKDKDNTGSALLTDLFNYAMPLINYQLGDELQINEEKNKTYSYNGQVINKVFGRTSDVVRLENGAVLTGPGFTILFKDLPVEAYSIEKNGYNSLLCNIKKQTRYNKEHENLIISTLKKQAGSETEIFIKYIDEFELTKSGKRRYFIAN